MTTALPVDRPHLDLFQPVADEIFRWGNDLNDGAGGPQECQSPLPAVGDPAPKIEAVLVVEDDDTVRTYLRHTLTRSGYEVLTAASGDEAIPLIGGQKVDIVVSDVIMPKMNGVEMYRKMKKILPNLKVVFLSGYPLEELTAKGISLKPYRFLQKPFSREELLQMVREALDE